MVDHPLPPSYSDTTNSSGHYEIRTNYFGSFSIQAIDLASNFRMIHFNNTIIDSFANVGTDTLKNIAALKVQLPIEPLSSDAYIFIPGKAAE